CLDGSLAGRDRGLGGERLCRSGCERRALVLFRHAPRRPGDERARELDVGVRLRKRVGDCLVRADRLAELDARLRVLETEVEGALRDAERLRGCGGAETGSFVLEAQEAAGGVDGCDVAVGRQRRDVAEVEAWVADVSHLLQQQRLLDEAY